MGMDIGQTIVKNGENAASAILAARPVPCHSVPTITSVTVSVRPLQVYQTGVHFCLQDVVRDVERRVRQPRLVFLSCCFGTVQNLPVHHPRRRLSAWRGCMCEASSCV